MLIYSMRFYNRSKNLEILSQFFKRVKLKPDSLATAKSSSFAMLPKKLCEISVKLVFAEVYFDQDCRLDPT